MMIKKNEKNHKKQPQSRITICLPKNQIRQIDEARKDIPRSKYLQRMIENQDGKVPTDSSKKKDDPHER